MIEIVFRKGGGGGGEGKQGRVMKGVDDKKTPQLRPKRNPPNKYNYQYNRYHKFHTRRRVDVLEGEQGLRNGRSPKVGLELLKELLHLRLLRRRRARHRYNKWRRHDTYCVRK